MDTVATLSTEDNETMQAFNKVSEFVSKARDAIISASTLAKEVGELREQFNALKAEMEEAHRKNADFEQQLAFVRQERDTALRDVEIVRNENATLGNALNSTRHQLEAVEGDRARLTTENQELLTQREAARLEQKRLLDELESVRNERDKIVQDIEAIHAMFQPKPVQPRSPEGQFQSPYGEPQAAE